MQWLKTLFKIHNILNSYGAPHFTQTKYSVCSLLSQTNKIDLGPKRFQVKKILGPKQCGVQKYWVKKSLTHILFLPPFLYILIYYWFVLIFYKMKEIIKIRITCVKVIQENSRKNSLLNNFFEIFCWSTLIFCLKHIKKIVYNCLTWTCWEVRYL